MTLQRSKSNILDKMSSFYVHTLKTKLHCLQRINFKSKECFISMIRVIFEALSFHLKRKSATNFIKMFFLNSCISKYFTLSFKCYVAQKTAMLLYLPMNIQIWYDLRISSARLCQEWFRFLPVLFMIVAFWTTPKATRMYILYAEIYIENKYY